LWNASLASSGSELLVLDFNFIICTTINIFYESFYRYWLIPFDTLIKPIVLFESNIF
jgi:hypothetical protein